MFILECVSFLFVLIFVYFNLQKESQIYHDAKTLEEFFNQLLEKWLPAYAYEHIESDDDFVNPPQRKYRRIRVE